MSKLSTLVKMIVADGKMSDKEMVDWFLENMDCDDCDVTKDYMKLYTEAYGHKINKALAEDWVHHMAVTDGSSRATGQKWTMELCAEQGNKIGINWQHICKIDWYVVMNMMYSDYWNTAKEINKQDEPLFFARLARDWLMDEDVENKLFDYYFYVA